MDDSISSEIYFMKWSHQFLSGYRGDDKLAKEKIFNELTKELNDSKINSTYKNTYMEEVGTKYVIKIFL